MKKKARKQTSQKPPAALRASPAEQPAGAEPTLTDEEQFWMLVMIVADVVDLWVPHPTVSDTLEKIDTFIRARPPADAPGWVRAPYAAAHAFARLFRHDFHDDLWTFLADYTGKHGSVTTLLQRPTAEGDLTPNKQKWCMSIVGLALYRVWGEQPVLPLFPWWFAEDSLFFFEQPWIRRVLAEWRQKRDKVTFDHAVWGTPQGRGKRRFSTRWDQALRQWYVVQEVDRLRAQGLGVNAALRRVQVELAAQQPGTPVSFSTVRKDYDRGLQEPNPFVALFASLAEGTTR